MLWMLRIKDVGMWRMDILGIGLGEGGDVRVDK